MAHNPLQRLGKTRPCAQTRVGHPILANTVGNAIANGVSQDNGGASNGQAGATPQAGNNGAGAGDQTQGGARTGATQGGDAAQAGDIVVTARRSSEDGIVDPPYGSVQIWTIPRGAALVPVMRRAGESFTTSALNAESHQGLSLVVNGEQYGLTGGSLPGGYTIADYLGYPGDLSATHPIGEVIQNGKLITGSSSPNTFYIAETKDSSGNIVYDFGQGNPSSSSLAAFGGGIPLIIDGLKYGSTNLYAAGTTGPLIGDPGSAADNLIQRSNAGFAAYSRYPDGGVSTGKVIVAYSDSSGQLAIAVQPDNASDGRSLAQIRDHLAASGYNNAIAFDGSSSATLIMNNSVKIAPSTYKNDTINVGIGVKLKGR